MPWMMSCISSSESGTPRQAEGTASVMVLVSSPSSRRCGTNGPSPLPQGEGASALHTKSAHATMRAFIGCANTGLIVAGRIAVVIEFVCLFVLFVIIFKLDQLHFHGHAHPDLEQRTLV